MGVQFIMSELDDIFNGWKDSSNEHEESVKVLEQWFETYYEQVCRDAIVHDDPDSLEFLQELDMYFASIRFFSKRKDHNRAVKEMSRLAEIVKPWLE